MNKNILILLLALVGMSSQAQSWQWAQSFGGTQTDAGNSITTDLHGNVYVTGTYNATSIAFGNDTLTNATNKNFFVTKFNGNGNVLWTRGSTGNSKASGTSITTDLSGNVYVAGTFNSFIDTAIIFGNDTLANFGGTNGSTDIFIVKYDSSGTLLMAKKVGGKGSDVCTGIVLDNSGNIYVSGYFASGYTTTDSLVFGSTSLHANGVGNMFLLKFNSSINPVYAKTQTGNGQTQANSVATDSIGNVYVTGYYIDSAISFGSTTLPTPGNTSYVFLVKYNSAGTVMWAKGTGSSKNDNSYAVATNRLGQVFITGNFAATTVFGSYSLTNTATNSSYMFLACYDSLGNVLWAKSGSLGTYNFGYGLATDKTNNVYVTGLFEGGITFDSVTSISSGKGVFITKYNTNGNVFWAANAASSNPPIGYGIAVDSALNIYVTGITNGAVNFGNTSLPFYGVTDIFVAKLSNSLAGMNEVTKGEMKIIAYPNPSKGAFTLFTQNNVNGFRNHEIRLVDIFGRVVFSLKENNSTTEENINVSNLDNGIYFLEVVSNKEILGRGKIEILK